MISPSRKSTLWVIATLLVAMAPQFARMPVLVAAITLAPLLWRLAAEFRNWKPLPALVRYAVTGIALVTLFMSYDGALGRRSAVSLLATMLALKLIESYSIRDERLIVSFCLFLCATQFLFAQGILMPFYGAVTVVMALVSLAQLQRVEAFSPVREVPRVKASIFSELGFSFRLLALAVPIGIALFLFFPRWGSPMWGIPENALDAKTGLSDSMSPGSIENLFMDDSPAFRAEFEGEVPGPADLYWRGPVLWNFDGQTWSGSFYGSNIKAKSWPDETTARWHYTVQLEPNERRWLFALDYPAIVPHESRISMDFQILRRQPVIQLLQYSMASNPNFMDMPDLPATLRSIALDLPEGRNPETRGLVEQWRRESSGDAALIRRALEHFNQEEFHYSLQSPLLGGDTIDEFMFDTRTGYCEHYASAFTVMMRMAGIPARVVTGYQGGWFNEIGNYMLVRQSDAHAWSEVWLPSTGWTRIDPTAAVSPLRVAQGSLGALSAPRHMFDYEWLRTMRNGFDLVQQRWNDWVIEFGAGSQARMFSSFGLERMSPAVLVSVLFVLISLFSVVLLPFVLRVKGPARKDPVQLVWQRFLKRLKSTGFEAPPSSGAIELAQAASLHLPEDASTIQVIASLYSRYRYSAEPPGLQELKSAVGNYRPKIKAA